MGPATARQGVNTPGSANKGELAPRSSMNKGGKKLSRVTISEPLPERKQSTAVKGGSASSSSSASATYLDIDPGLKDRTGLKEEELRELIEIFSLVDVDHGGTISTDELATLMKTLGLKASQDELDAIVKELDAQGTGEIDFECEALRYQDENDDVERQSSSVADGAGESQGVGGVGGSAGGTANAGGQGVTQNGGAQYDGNMPTSLVIKILTEYGDPDRRMMRREAEEIISSVGPAGPAGTFNYQQFIQMYIG
ncbi:hypothetical protein HDU67_008616, partial [Dinochytrium kinnereticum]